MCGTLRLFDVSVFPLPKNGAIPDELSTQAMIVLAPPAPIIPPDNQRTAIIGILVCDMGDLSESEGVREAYSPATYDRLVRSRINLTRPICSG